jgi:chromosomal replication initiation ATPase DnaA
MISLAAIIAIVSNATNISADEIRGPRGKIATVQARHLVFFLARKYSAMSYRQIARIMNRRDHTCVIHGAAEMAKHIETNEFAARLYNHCNTMIRCHASFGKKRQNP